MDPTDMFEDASTLIVTTQQLIDAGILARQLQAEVSAGRLLRVRRGHYALPFADPGALRAVRIGGLLSCASAAGRLGIWVPDHPFVHVAMRHEASRMRSPRDRFTALSADNRDGCELHWWPFDADAASLHSVGLLDALAAIIRCQPRRLAVAALDSALFEKKVDAAGLHRIFASVPDRYAPLLDDVDGQSMSGIESIVRLMARDAGLRCEIQVRFRGIGIVDLVIEGCVAIEVDGRRNHDGAANQRRDYDRDLALAALGFSVVRCDYPEVMHHPERVLAAIWGALRSHRRFRGIRSV
jgi:very-short-patch-repair endonuclease